MSLLVENAKTRKEIPGVKFYPKGEEVPYTTREGKKANYVNNDGEHLVRMFSGNKLVNRKDYRRAKMSMGSNLERKPGAKHVVNKPNYKLELPTHDPKLTNHLRHRQRQVVREMNREIKQKEATNGQEATT